MNATQLHIVTGPGEHKPSGVWFCQKCNHVHINQASAEECCQPYKCSVCGRDVETRYQTICKPCRDAKEEREDRERFEKATKLTPEQYDGWVYREGYGNDDYSQSVDELCEQCDYEGCDRPAYAWACKPKEFVKVRLSRVLEDICDEGYEDFDVDDLKGLDELKAAVAAFEMANRMHVAYEPDFSRAILIPQEHQRPDEDEP